MVKITTSDEYKEAVDEETIWVDYKNIVNVLDVGKEMFIDDGLIGLVVKEKGICVISLEKKQMNRE